MPGSWLAAAKTVQIHAKMEPCEIILAKKNYLTLVLAVFWLISDQDWVSSTREGKPAVLAVVRK